MRISLFALWLLAFGVSAAELGDHKVVYHVTDPAVLPRVLRNVENHLAVDPAAHIVVVANSDGIDLLLRGAKGRNGNAYEPMADSLQLRGVRFEVCENTMRMKALQHSDFISAAGFTASGVARVAELQRSGYSYIKP